jgi:DNA-binding transcriptional ArsR family regulator
VDKIIEITDPIVVRALAHPLRLAVLSALRDRTASPRELALELGVSLPKLSYHVRELAGVGLILLVEERPVRGVKEHFYTAAGRTFVSAEVYQALPDAIQHSLVDSWVSEAQADIRRQLDANAFATTKARLNRVAVWLDERAQDRFARAVDDLYALSIKLEEQSASRKTANSLVNLTLLLGVRAPNEQPGRDAN